MIDMKRLWLKLLVCVLIIGLLPQAALAKTSDEAYAVSYRCGTVQMLSTADTEKPLTDSFYYTDDWFREDPVRRNDGLARISMQLVAATTNDAQDGAGAGLLKDLGFDEIGFSGFGSEDPDGCAYTWAKKTITENGVPCTLLAVAIQSFSTDKEVNRKGWTQNFIVNGQTVAGEHHAFAVAADKAADDIAGLADGKNVKIWITGHSRGGALTNLLAVRLLQNLGAANHGIYAYTFEAPSTTEIAAAEAAQARYDYIHNYICSDDIVPMVPPWHMTLYGQIHPLKTKETDAQLKAELEKLGSSMAQWEQVISDGSKQEQLLAKLVQTIPARADYSEQKTDTFMDTRGETGSVTYVYQDAFRDLMGVIFGDGSSGGVSLGQILLHEDELLSITENVVRGIRATEDGDAASAASAYWQATQELKTMAEELGLDLQLTDADLYALLKTAGPVVIDATYQPGPDDDVLDRLLGYLNPGLELFEDKDLLIASHHFDTGIARLHTLAPVPQTMQIQVKSGKNWTTKKTVTLKKGKKVRIRVVLVDPIDGTKTVLSSGVRYTSSKKKIAVVTAGGVIKGKKKGTCRISVRAPGNLTQTIPVKVK